MKRIPREADHWKSVQPYWPRRLLYIPSLTSVERHGGDEYNGISKPKYGVLTYTWGRWQRPSGTHDALPVKSTPWTIPCVDPAHFTVDAFGKVIKRMHDYGLAWAWIDIACINQEDRAEKMDEIGRQASIFKNADTVFVWLCSSPKSVLQKAFDDLWITSVRFVSQVAGDNLRPSDEFATIVPHIANTINTICKDPWFTSLWTLQEATLCRNSLILCKEGEPIPHSQNDSDVWLAMFVNCIANVHKDLSTLISMDKKNAHEGTKRQFEAVFFNGLQPYEQARLVIDMIDRTGFNHLYSENANVAYAAAKHRQTQHPLDRIYGIMQVYNLRVGEALRPKEASPTFEELADEFALALHARSAILGQCFVHEHSPVQGKSWRISQHCKIPQTLRMFGGHLEEASIYCNISRRVDGHIGLQGVWTPMSAFLKETSWFLVILDEYIEATLDPESMSLTELYNSYNRYWQERRIELLSKKVALDKLGVVLLGIVPNGKDWKTADCHGLIVETINAGGPLSYRRLGLLQWYVDLDIAEGYANRPLWTHVDAVYL